MCPRRLHIRRRRLRKLQQFGKHSLVIKAPSCTKRRNCTSGADSICLSSLATLVPSSLRRSSSFNLVSISLRLPSWYRRIFGGRCGCGWLRYGQITVAKARVKLTIVFVILVGIGIVLTYEMCANFTLAMKPPKFLSLSYAVHSFLDLDRIAWAINASLGTSTAIDFFIAGTMCYYLRQSKGLETHLNSRISRLMQYTLGSGLFTSACSLSAMFSYILLPNTFIVLALEFLLTKLYVGSFLAMLNSRQRARRPNEEEPSIAMQKQLLKLQSLSINFRNPSTSSSLPLTSPLSAYSQDSTRGEKFHPWR